mgnify:CR=1 FL=1
MIQSQWTEDGIALVDSIPGKLQPGWVRIKVSACGICGSDLHTYRRHQPVNITGTPGHEFVGTIIDGPAGLDDRMYAIEPFVYCGKCLMCTSGKPQLCSDKNMLGGQLRGGLSEFVDVPPVSLHPVDKDISPLVASISEPLAVSFRAVDLSSLTKDSRVLILGGGTIGLLSGMLSKEATNHVAITVRYPHQKSVAQSIGLEPVEETNLQDWAGNSNPDVVIETVGGAGSALTQAVRYCSPSGKIIVTGVFHETPPINATRLVTREIEMIGSFLYGTDFGTSVALVPKYLKEIGLIQTHQFDLQSVSEAFQCADDKSSESIKVTVLP